MTSKGNWLHGLEEKKKSWRGEGRRFPYLDRVGAYHSPPYLNLDCPQSYDDVNRNEADIMIKIC
jgi:hypothetical protein